MTTLICIIYVISETSAEPTTAVAVLRGEKEHTRPLDIQPSGQHYQVLDLDDYCQPTLVDIRIIIIRPTRNNVLARLIQV